MFRTGLFYALAAFAEIAGCYAVWMVLRREAPVAWLVVAAMLLGAFAWFLSRTDQQFAGRTFAAYGGVYVAASVVWLWSVESETPRGTDLLGVALVLAGAGVILAGGARQ